MLPLAESARFGEQFALTFLLAQLAVLVLLTPAYAAGGIAEEKEKKTFVFLLVSDLTSREILFGKFLGRLTFLLGVLLAGLPILALTQFFGGMSLKFLLMSYLITAATVTMLAAVSAAAACATDTYRGALFRGYGLTGLVMLVGGGLHPMLSPLAVIPLLGEIEADSPGVRSRSSAWAMPGWNCWSRLGRCGSGCGGCGRCGRRCSARTAGRPATPAGGGRGRGRTSRGRERSTPTG